MCDRWDIVGLIGILLFSAGAGWIWPPLGLLTLGVFCIAIYLIRELSNVSLTSINRYSDDSEEFVVKDESGAGGER